MPCPARSIVICALVGNALLTGCGRQDATPPVVTPFDAPKPVVEKTTPVPMTPPRSEPYILPEFVAQLRGSQSIEVRTPVEGYVIQQRYADCAEIRKGDVLFIIDAKSSTPMQDASAGQQTTPTKIVAPIDGVAGAAVHGEGDLVERNSVLAHVEVTDPVRADFKMKDQRGDPKDAVPGLADLILPDGAIYPERGHWFLEKKLSENGVETMETYALFPNHSGRLKPGDYVKVRGVAPGM